MLSRPVPATCTVRTLVCRNVCCTISAYRHTCTYNMLYSLSRVREQCDDRLCVSLKFFPLHPFSSQEQESYSRALIIECGCHDDVGSKNCRNACALISDHLASTWKPKPSLSPVAYRGGWFVGFKPPPWTKFLGMPLTVTTRKLYDFLHWFVTVLYHQHQEFYLLTWWVNILNSMLIQLQYQWSYWTGSKGPVNACFVNSLCVC